MGSRTRSFNDPGTYVVRGHARNTSKGNLRRKTLERAPVSQTPSLALRQCRPTTPGHASIFQSPSSKNGGRASLLVSKIIYLFFRRAAEPIYNADEGDLPMWQPQIVVLQLWGAYDSV